MLVLLAAQGNPATSGRLAGIVSEADSGTPLAGPKVTSYLIVASPHRDDPFAAAQTASPTTLAPTYFSGTIDRGGARVIAVQAARQCPRMCGISLPLMSTNGQSRTTRPVYIATPGGILLILGLIVLVQLAAAPPPDKPTLAAAQHLFYSGSYEASAAIALVLEQSGPT